LKNKERIITNQPNPRRVRNRDHYKLQRFLGAGRFATTYKAKVLKEELKREYGEFVAIKIPLSKDFESVLLKELVLNATLNSNLQGMKSPNIVSYLGFDDYWDEDGDRHTVMIMEYCDGGNLRKKIGEIGNQDSLEIKDAVNIMLELSEGLKLIHQCRLFHRDISPENILFSGSKNNQIAKLADFGVSTMLLQSEFATSHAGKIYYMAPEVLKGEGNFLSDIYSLGVVFYEMTTGQLPIKQKKGALNTMNAIVSQDPEPPSTINPDIDPVLENIILKMINRDYTKRFQSAKEFQYILTKYSQGIDPVEEEINNALLESYTYSRENNFDKAESTLKELLARFPDNTKIYLNLGELYNRWQRYAEAIEIFQKGIKLDKKFALFYRDLAFSQYNLNRKKEAIQNLEKALEYDIDKSLVAHTNNLLRIWKNE
jgi:serine/threonine protein kinase